MSTHYQWNAWISTTGSICDSCLDSEKINYSRYGRDGANYTSRAIFDCYYNQMDNSSAILDYQPKRYPYNDVLFMLIMG